MAASLPRLVVDRSSDTADCPDAAALALAVERQMRRRALDPTSEDSTAPVYEIRIVLSADGYAATIRAGDLTRELSDPGSTCDELADALALTLAILLDSEEAPPPPPPPPPEAPPPTTELPPKYPEPPIVLGPIVLPVKIRFVKRVPDERVPDWNLGFEGGVGETVGFLSPASFAGNIGLFFRYRRASFGVGLFVMPGYSVENVGGGGVDLQLTTGTVHVCGRILGQTSGVHLSLCGQSFVGAIHGAGRGFPINREGTRPWVALGGMGLLEGPLFGRLGWSMRMSLGVPVVSQRFTITRTEGSGTDAHETTTTLFEPQEGVEFVGIGLHYTFF